MYKGKLLNGEMVAVKVQRPDAVSQMAKDLYFLRKIAELNQGIA